MPSLPNLMGVDGIIWKGLQQEFLTARSAYTGCIVSTSVCSGHRYLHIPICHHQAAAELPVALEVVKASVAEWQGVNDL